MNNNPFDLIEQRLVSIENLILNLKNQPAKTESILSDQFLTIQEAAELLHLTVPTIYSKVSKGELPGVMKQSKRLYFSRIALIEYLKEGRRKTNAEIESEADQFLKRNRKGGVK